MSTASSKYKDITPVIIILAMIVTAFIVAPHRNDPSNDVNERIRDIRHFQKGRIGGASTWSPSECETLDSLTENLIRAIK